VCRARDPTLRSRGTCFWAAIGQPLGSRAPSRRALGTHACSLLLRECGKEQREPRALTARGARRARRCAAPNTKTKSSRARAPRNNPIHTQNTTVGPPRARRLLGVSIFGGVAVFRAVSRLPLAAGRATVRTLPFLQNKNSQHPPSLPKTSPSTQQPLVRPLQACRPAHDLGRARVRRKTARRQSGAR
jgi:hypothetical protein